MNMTAFSTINRYISVSHWFIPERLQQKPLELSRAQNVITAAVIAGISDPFYALLYHLLGFESAAYVILLCGAFMVSAPFVLKVTGNIKVAEAVFLSAVFFNFSWLTYHLGGVEAPTAPWLIICPVVAMLLGGVASGIFWLAMSSLAISCIYLLEASGMQLPVSPIENTLLLHALCGVGLFFVVVIFVLFFELTRTQGFIKLERALKVIQELAIRDELTGTYNRRHLIKLIEDEKDRASRLNSPFCVCLLDIDHFKRINDTYGHSAGDKVLRAVAETVQCKIRTIDAFGRYGGEEFLLLLPKTTLDEAFALAERVRIGIEQIRFPEFSGSLTVTASIGIAEFQPGENISQSVARADQALYQAKSSGRNRIIRYDRNDLAGSPNDLNRLDEKLRIEVASPDLYSQVINGVTIDPATLKNQLRDALYRGELFLQYQPQIDIRTNEVIGVEALIRWQHPELGVVLPDQFIPLAEDAGLIIPIGEWVLTTACMQNSAWREAGLPPIKTAVNLSVRQLSHPGLVESIRAIIRETGIDPAYVELEITEGLAIDNLHLSKKVISQLRAMGMKIAIDDFGTGYSSLSYLNELPLDILKMDGSFVKYLGATSSEESSYVIAEAIISMAHSLNLKVIAEAVETEQQLRNLRKMKCDQLQGFLFSRPLPPYDVAKVLRKQSSNAEERFNLPEEGFDLSQIKAVMP